MNQQLRKALARLVMAYSDAGLSLPNDGGEIEQAHERLAAAIDAYRRARGLPAGWSLDIEVAIGQS